MTRETRAPAWMTALTRRFVAGEIDAATFVVTYQRDYHRMPVMNETRFVIVDRLFFVCEEYCVFPEIREPEDTTDEGLLAAAQRALRELEELGDC